MNHSLLNFLIEMYQEKLFDTRDGDNYKIVFDTLYKYIQDLFSNFLEPWTNVIKNEKLQKFYDNYSKSFTEFIINKDPEVQSARSSINKFYEKVDFDAILINFDLDHNAFVNGHNDNYLYENFKVTDIINYFLKEIDEPNLENKNHAISYSFYNKIMGKIRNPETENDKVIYDKLKKLMKFSNHIHFLHLALHDSKGTSNLYTLSKNHKDIHEILCKNIDDVVFQSNFNIVIEDMLYFKQLLFEGDSDGIISALIQKTNIIPKNYLNFF